MWKVSEAEFRTMPLCTLLYFYNTISSVASNFTVVLLLRIKSCGLILLCFCYRPLIQLYKIIPGIILDHIIVYHTISYHITSHYSVSIQLFCAGLSLYTPSPLTDEVSFVVVPQPTCCHEYSILYITIQQSVYMHHCHEYSI